MILIMLKEALYSAFLRHRWSPKLPKAAICSLLPDNTKLPWPGKFRQLSMSNKIYFTKLITGSLEL